MVASFGAGAGARSDRVVLVHRTRGRARFKVLDLFGVVTLAAPLEHAVAAVPGVQRVSANAVTGGLLVLFDSSCSVEQLHVRLLELLRRDFGMPLDTRAPDNSEQPLPSNVTSLTAHRRRLVRPLADEAQSLALVPADKVWWAMAHEQTLRVLESDGNAGLSTEVANDRLRRYGLNKLAAAQRRSEFSILLSQFRSLPVAMLGASAVISVATGGVADAIVILGVVAINAVVGFLTERQAERTIDALGKVVPKGAQVRRDGQVRSISVQEIAVGDLVLLAPGDHIPADMRLLQAETLIVDESPLTGESMPVRKSREILDELDIPLGERRNMAYMGTMVTGGSGIGVVIATGRSTEIGRIQDLVGTTRPPETPMQRQLDTLGTQLGLLGGAVCVGVFFVGLWRGYGWLEMLKSSVSLAVAAVPEGLPAVATTTLALGIKKMHKQRVAVRHVDAVETLGAVQIFCFDKTGTLTQNRMTVLALHAGSRSYTVDGGQLFEGERQASPLHSDSEIWQLLRVVSLCTEHELPMESDANILNASPTENALIDVSMRLGVDVRALRAACPRLRVQYRSEGHPYVYTVHTLTETTNLIAVKGSPAEVLAMCRDMRIDGKRVALDDDQRAMLIAENDRMAGDALRVLGVAYAVFDAGSEMATSELTWLGLVGMADPLRSGMRDLMHTFHEAGIETVMITGDQSATAYAIGKQLGLSNGKPLQILDSTSLDKLDPQLLAGLVRRTHVFSRVSPAHKLQIVQAIQRAGYVVAMTGDGINDGPALKAADIGVALGESGTDVARSVADVVLEDDNLKTMVSAVSQGRTIHANIRKAVHFLLSTNFSEIEVMLAGTALGLGQPLNSMQLLWINLATDILPGLALSLEPPEEHVLTRPPRDPKEAIVRRADLLSTGLESSIITAGTMASYLYGLHRYGPGSQASTISFNALTIAQILHAYACRSDEASLFTPTQRPRNRHLDAAVAGTLALQVLVGSIPGMRKLLGTSPLNISDIAVVFAAAAGPMLVNQVVKHVRVGEGRDAPSQSFIPPSGAGRP